jgi:hypothetical protein
MKTLFLGFAMALLCGVVFAREVVTNEVAVADAPKWLTPSKVNKTVERIQKLLEWDIRRVNVKWYYDEAAFEKAHGFGAGVLAFARKTDNSVHVGPTIDASNFDGTFGHELSHVILFQKYKDAIPKWLEEGLANYMGKRGEVDYAWLASQPARSVHSLVHPFSGLQGGDAPNPRYHYMASTALMQMIAAKCSIHDLLQLSVGKNLESYLSTFCGIDDVDEAFKKWLVRKAPARKNLPSSEKKG